MEGESLGLGMMLIALAIYLIPAFVAGARNHPNTLAITLLNLLLGWTLLGWVGALVWATLSLSGQRSEQ